VEELIGPNTVNTMPPATIDAFRDHGAVQRTVDKKLGAAEGLLKEIEAAGISIKEVTAKLLVDGIASFQKSFDELLAGIDTKISSLAPGGK
jgi:transaldolase